MKLPIKRRTSQDIAEKERDNLRERLFDDSFLQPLLNWQPFLGFEMMRPMRRMIDRVESWLPRTDISETDKEFKVALDVPHVDPKNIEISVEENSLIINGTTEEERQAKDEKFYQIERQYGEFRRIVDLPAGIDEENISAETKHGTLYVTVPKKPEMQRKKIKVAIKEKE